MNMQWKAKKIMTDFERPIINAFAKAVSVIDFFHSSFVRSIFFYLVSSYRFKMLLVSLHTSFMA